MLSLFSGAEAYTNDITALESFSSEEKTTAAARRSDTPRCLHKWDQKWQVLLAPQKNTAHGGDRNQPEHKPQVHCDDAGALTRDKALVGHL